MNGNAVTRATLGRLPIYLKYLKSICLEQSCVSAPNIAKALGLGEVQVRKDLCSISGAGKPRIGYVTGELIESIEGYLGRSSKCQTVIVGAGKLGRALLDFGGFEEFGLEIAAAFDINIKTKELSATEKPIYPMEEFERFCYCYGIKVGIITVPESEAQGVCDLMVKNNITAVWSFAEGQLMVPHGVALRQENLALSLAHLTKQI